MGPTSPDEFTLSTLPQDIIRRLIRMNSAWSIHKLRFISKSWNALVSVFFRNRPPVDWLCMTETARNTLEVIVKAQRNHFRHFAINMIFQWKLVKIEKASAIIKFDIDLNDSWLTRWLFRLFMSTNNVKLLELRDLEQETLDIVDKAMRHVEIGQLDMRQEQMDQYLWKYIRQIVRRHRIIDVGLVADYFNGRELCQYLVSLPEFVRFVYIKISKGLPQKPKATSRFWNAFAQENQFTMLFTLVLFALVPIAVRADVESWITVEGSVYCRDELGLRIPIPGLNMTIYEEDFARNTFAYSITDAQGRYSITTHDHEEEAEFSVSIRQKCSFSIQNLYKCAGVRTVTYNERIKELRVGETRCRCNAEITCQFMLDHFVPLEHHYRSREHVKPYKLDVDITKTHIQCSKVQCYG